MSSAPPRGHPPHDLAFDIGSHPRAARCSGRNESSRSSMRPRSVSQTATPSGPASRSSAARSRCARSSNSGWAMVAKLVSPSARTGAAAAKAPSRSCFQRAYSSLRCAKDICRAPLRPVKRPSPRSEPTMTCSWTGSGVSRRIAITGHSSTTLVTARPCVPRPGRCLARADKQKRPRTLARERSF